MRVLAGLLLYSAPQLMREVKAMVEKARLLK